MQMPFVSAASFELVFFQPRYMHHLGSNDWYDCISVTVVVVHLFHLCFIKKLFEFSGSIASKW